ncbi:MAG: hypothetical protein ACXVXY_07215 [Mycobacteriaceae bacterium]
MSQTTTADERHEEASREDITEALGYLCRAAKRQPCVVGTDEYPSRWDQAHRRINDTLTMLEAL